MFGLNHWEILIVLVVMLLLFGPRLPNVMRGLGKSVTEFKRGMHDITDEVSSAATKAPATDRKDENDSTPPS